MDDLISRKWLLECIEQGWIKFDTEKDKNKFIHLVRDTAPSVDAVEVVRCADCKHCQVDNLFDNYWCDGQSVWADHYCSKGERR